MLTPLLLLSLATVGSDDFAASVDDCLEGKTADWLRDPQDVQAALRAALRPETSRLKGGNVRKLQYAEGSSARAPLEYVVQLPLD